jgi:hypothetical protein
MPFISKATHLGGALYSAGSAAYTNYKEQKRPPPASAGDGNADAVERRRKKQLGEQSELYEILACMVQGVYAADRGKEGASLFWETFGYEEEALRDEQMTDEEIAAVGKPSCKIRLKVFRRRDLVGGHGETPPLPKYVIAIRGTRKFCQRDILADLQILCETLHHNQLYDIVKNMTRKVVQKHNHDTVCVAGHSLGAAIGLIVTRELALEDMAVETHLFNPPFFSLETLMEQCAKAGAKGFDKMSRAFKAAGSEELPSPLLPRRITKFVKAKKTKPDAAYLEAMATEFTRLQKWTPCLYVNQHDWICNGYIDYFRKQNMFYGGPDTLAISLTAGPLRRFASLDSHSYHLIPSAHLHINHRGANVLKSHPLEQWHDHPTDNLVQEIHDLVAQFSSASAKKNDELELRVEEELAIGKL